jgi:2,4-dienoyl-CoA reductase-like NADH-dependent reductase (Old Yellow Enzyme family)
MTTTLFSPYSLRKLELRNRIIMSPMCMYAAGDDGQATDWHLSHYHARAAGGVGLILLEATAVEPRGRISRGDLGLWGEPQVPPLTQLIRLAKGEGAAVGVQLAHAGRKAFGTERGHGPQTPVGPSPLAFDEGWRVPAKLSSDDIRKVIAAWRRAAVLARAAGFDVIEIHAAHGYLNHQFLSPLANQRTDEYGGSLENRMRFLLEVVDAVRDVWPDDSPLLVRLSVTDWTPAGLTPGDQVIVARALKAHGVDLVDCSTGGILPIAPATVGPDYQVPFADQLRRQAGVPTAAVGLITEPEQAHNIVTEGRADLVALGRALLRHPYWPLHAARALGAEVAPPRQYRRAWLG